MNSELFQTFPGLATAKELKQFVNAVASRMQATQWQQGHEHGPVWASKEELAGFAHPIIASLERRCRLVLGGAGLRDTDASLLRHAKDTYSDPHLSHNYLEGRHVCCGLLIQAPARGGELKIEDVPVPLLAGDAVVFYPDVDKQRVTKVVCGTRLMLTAGIILDY